MNTTQLNEMKRVAAVFLLASAALAHAACYRASAVGSHMWQHFDRGDDVQELVRLGELERARGSARWLAQHSEPEGLPAGSAPYSNALRSSAQRVADAETVADAAVATGQLGGGCGTCHRAYGVGPRFDRVGTAPEISSVAAEQMARHGWAADRMWEGLVGPSDERWQAGAAVLSRAPLYQRFLVGRWDAYDNVQRLAEHVEQLGRRAQKAHDPAERAEIYGEFLGTCSSCHTLIRNPR